MGNANWIDLHFLAIALTVNKRQSKTLEATADACI